MTNAEVHDFVEVYEYLAGEGGNLHVLLFFNLDLMSMFSLSIIVCLFVSFR